MPSKYLVRLAATAAVAALTVTGCSTSSSNSSTIRVGIVCGGIGLAALTIDEGKLDGVEAEQICFDSGSDAVQALSGGSIDAFVGAGEHVIRNRIKNLDVKGYAVLSQVPPYSLVTTTSSAVQRVADLAGKSVAVTAPGSLSDTELQRAAAENGLDYKGLRVVGSGTGATMQATIEKGGAEAGMVTDPLLTTMVQSGNFRVVWKPSFQYVALAVIARQSWVDGHRETMTKFVQGARATQQRGTADLAAAVEVAKKQAPNLNEQTLEQVVRTTLEQAPDGLVVDDAVYADTVGLLEEVGQIKPDAAPPFAEAFDFDLLK